jgi:Flp pilus assembly protein TadG
MITTRQNRLHRQHGQALVEFALTFPVTIMVIFSLLGFAYLFYAYVTMQLAVRDAASSIVHNPNQTIAEVQSTLLSSMVTLDQSHVGIDIQPSDPSTWDPGVQINVTGYYTVSLPIPALGTIRFQAQSVMTID